MGTTALVGIEQKDGSIKYRKVYTDGYLSHTGVILLQQLNRSNNNKLFCADNFDSLNCGELKTAKDETDFIKSWFCVCEYYLYKKGKWYNGNWHYNDGYLHDVWTGEKTRKVREETLECEQDWKPLEEKFIKKRRVIIDYIEINPEGEE